MDKASESIDRHTPTIPSSCYLGMTPATERLHTLMKNKYVLPAAGLSPKRKKPTKTVTITDADLLQAEQAIASCVGVFSDRQQEYLSSRQITYQDTTAFNICSLEALQSKLSDATIHALSLHIPDEFRGGSGISIPFFHTNRFMGFCTRIIDNDFCKYTVSIPNRYCFGVKYPNDDVYVVEGVFDGIAMLNRGFNCLAMADSQPNYYKMWVANHFRIIRILLDNDYAGWLGTYKAYIILTEMLDRNPQSIEILQCEHDPATPGFEARKITIADLTTKLGIPHGQLRHPEDC